MYETWTYSETAEFFAWCYERRRERLERIEAVDDPFAAMWAVLLMQINA
jgi:hypothetical protein